jgi:hypothetical protein
MATATKMKCATAKNGRSSYVGDRGALCAVTTLQIPVEVVPLLHKRGLDPRARRIDGDKIVAQR